MIWFYLLAFFSLLLFVYYLWIGRLLKSPIEVNKPERPYPVSLIICAKNEQTNLEQHLPLWLEQDHPDFELVLVNDRSTDQSGELMERWAQLDSRVKVVDVRENEAFWANKKYALTLGIKRATHQRMVFTDADCRPGDKSWLRKISGLFSAEVQIVLGYSPYVRQKGLLNSLIRYETFVTAAQYLNSGFTGSAYMGVGRNLAYTQNLFYEYSGFMNHMQLPSGDDDLFVNQAATSSNVVITLDPETFTYSKAESNWTSWFRQKRRHLTTARHYKGRHRTMLALLYLTRWSFWILLIIGLFHVPFWWVLIPAALVFAIQYSVQGQLARRMEMTGLVPYFPLLDLLLLWTQIAIFSANLFAKPKHWK
jgi:glycosyltransferase involved in cell wall biosynthesis